LRSLQDADARWFDLGAAPTENVRVAKGLYHLQVTLDGYATLDHILAVLGSFLQSVADSNHLTLPPRFALLPNTDNPDDMVLVPGGEKTHTSLSGTMPWQYWSVGAYFLGLSITRLPAARMQLRSAADWIAGMRNRKYEDAPRLK
jgi:hypothetical protein